MTWLISDNLASTSASVDSTGELLNSFKYTAFGEIRTWSGTKNTDYLYTGQRNEAETGLYFYKARFYDPALGRFIQPDTLVPDPASSAAYDRYAYVNNNPVNFADPSGHRPCDDGNLDGRCDNLAGGGIGKSDGGRTTGGLSRDRVSGDSSSNTDGHQNNPLQIGCGGLFGYLEGSTCSNVNHALDILRNPKYTGAQRFWSGYYVTIVANTHIAIGVGLSIAAWQVITGAGSVCTMNPECTLTFSRIITESQIIGTKGNILNISGYQQTVINGLTYSGHAVDRMLQNGISPSVIEGVMKYEPSVGNTIITRIYYDPENNILVVQNIITGIIVTLGYGNP